MALVDELDGLVLGSYRLFDEFDTDLGTRAFAFTVEDDLHDLNLLIDGSFDSTEWLALAFALSVDGAGPILIQRRLTDGTYSTGG